LTLVNTIETKAGIFNLLKTTCLELTGITNKFTPVAIPNAVKKATNNVLTKLRAALTVGNIPPYVNATLVKMLKMMTGNWSAGIFARKVLLNQIAHRRKIPDTTACDELYPV
jgi:hypothetical protein